jgi:hypothetical protein
MPQVDLEQFHREWVFPSHVAPLIEELVVELRAAREVVDQARRQYGPRASLRLALEAYDKVVGR